MKKKFAPSIMCSKPWDMLTYVKEFEKSNIDMIHFDVMDGNFVPNIMLGSEDYKALHEVTKLPLDLHLMCINPAEAFTYFDVKEGDQVSFHPETCKGPYKLLQAIKNKGAKAGFAFSPATPITYIDEVKEILDFVLIMSVEPGFAGQKFLPDALNKIKRVADKNLNIDIFVDGNCNSGNVAKAFNAGATGVVIGSALLNKNNKAENFSQDFKSYLHALN
ncbi:MAG: ribulose-phosphate 3-epimerase [Coriobacteriia bacterium]|nr:ribulose-phosphate 3-epimerase [Coriobacteriia bacterium]